MAIVHKPDYTTQSEVDLDNRINKMLKPILHSAVKNGMSVETMSHVVHNCINSLVMEIYVEREFNNTKLMDNS